MSRPEDYELASARRVWDELPPEGRAAIPRHLRGGLDRYFQERILPGQFLQAVLANDLREAVCRCTDRETLLALPEMLQALYTWGPGNCLGSREAVEAWVRGGPE